MFVFGAFLVCLFPHSDWIRTRKSPNADTFHAVINVAPKKYLLAIFKYMWHESIFWDCILVFYLFPHFFEILSQQVRHLNDFQPTIFTKSSILVVWLGSVLWNSSLEPTTSLRMFKKQLPLQKKQMNGVLQY